MTIHPLSPLDAVASLKSSAEGLSGAEVDRRLRQYGRNGVEEEARSRPLWLRLLSEFIIFFPLILWVAAGLAFFADWSDRGQGMAKVGHATGSSSAARASRWSWLGPITSSPTRHRGRNSIT